MSWRRTITVWCDGCDEVIGRGDLGDQTVAEARSFARAEGAITGLPKGPGTVRTDESRDLCAECRKDPRARAKVGLWGRR